MLSQGETNWILRAFHILSEKVMKTFNNFRPCQVNTHVKSSKLDTKRIEIVFKLIKNKWAP